MVSSGSVVASKKDRPESEPDKSLKLRRSSVHPIAPRADGEAKVLMVKQQAYFKTAEINWDA
jgi:hypothetical protein